MQDEQPQTQANAARDAGERLKLLRKERRLTQAQAGELLGLSAAYIGELERGEKVIDARLLRRINDALRTRIDVSFSEGLGGWTVSVSAPIGSGGGPPGRRHTVIGKYADLPEAKGVAEHIAANRELGARIIVYPRATPATTTNPSGI
jgi:transcriptional regulator with XRE-family HTH domain